MQNPKAVLIIADGLGDRPIKELGDKTPLEAATSRTWTGSRPRASAG